MCGRIRAPKIAGAFAYKQSREAIPALDATGFAGEAVACQERRKSIAVGSSALPRQPLPPARSVFSIFPGALQL